MKRSIERALDLQPGDLGRGLLLSSCLFLIISSYVTGKVARDALFLSRFKAAQLAYVDIGSAVLIAFVVAAYVRTARRASLRDVLVGSQVFFAVNFLVFWVLATYYRPNWLFPVFYIWVGILGVLAPTQVWSLANHILTTREAKRIFGLVGGGAILGFIFAGFLSKTVARAFGTESLLLAMAALLLASAALMVFVKQKGEIKGNIQEKRAGPKDLRESLRLVVTSSYLRAIAAVICISCIVMTLTGWQFKALAKQFLVNKDALAIFFGNFNFYVGVLSLIFQLVLTTRLLRRFGVGKMLFALPLAVLAGSAAVLVYGTLVAAIFLNGTDQVVRYSLDKSTAELLYLPLPSSFKFQVKWFIDTVIWRLGDGLAGILVLIFATGLHLPARQMSWIAIALVGLWVVAVLVARQQYVVALSDSITQHVVDADAEPSAVVLDRSATELLATKASAADPKEILYALSLFEVEGKRAAHPVIRGLLNHESPEVRQKAIATFFACADKTALQEVQVLLKDPDLGVRTEALMYIARFTHVDPLVMLEDVTDFADFSVRSAVVAYLARPGEAQCLETARQILEVMAKDNGPASIRSRTEAARLLGVLPDCFDPLLSTLISDPSTVVACEAIRSVGNLRKERLVPQVLELLAKPELACAAADSLSRFGDKIVGMLQDHLSDVSVPITVRREIPAVMVSIGTPAAAQALAENLLERDATQRVRIISALNKLHESHPEIERDIQMLETVLAAELLGHYRSYQILHALTGRGDEQDAMARTLNESMQQELERIFRLLSLIYPRLNLHAAYCGLQSQDASVHDNALEFIDNVLNSSMREALVPLLDGRIDIAGRARLADRFVRSKIETPEEAVAALVSSDDPWLRSCGAYAIGTLGMNGLARELDRCLGDPNPLLRETARAAKERLRRVAAKA